APQNMPERMKASNPSSVLRSPPTDCTVCGGGSLSLMGTGFGGPLRDGLSVPGTSRAYLASTGMGGSDVTASDATKGSFVGNKHWPCALQTMTSTVTGIFFSPGSAFGLTTNGR